MTTFDRTQRGFAIHAHGTVADVYLYDFISNDSSEGGITPARFRDDLAAAGDVDLIRLYVNCPGGSVFAGWSMHAMLQRHPAKKHAIVDGLCASMATLVCCAADRIEMAAGAMFMLHKPFNANDDGSGEDNGVLGKIMEVMVNTYARRTGLSRSEIENILERESWFSAEEAMELGFIDAIVAPLAVAACSFDLSNFRHPPVIISAEERDLRERTRQLSAEVSADIQASIRAKTADLRAFLDKPKSLRRAESSRDNAARWRWFRSHPQRVGGAHEGGHGLGCCVLGAPIDCMLVREDGSGSVHCWDDHLSHSDAAIVDAMGAAAECVLGVSLTNDLTPRGQDLQSFSRHIEAITGRPYDDECIEACEARWRAYAICEENSVRLFVLAERALQTVGQDVPGPEAHQLFDAHRENAMIP